MLPVFQGKGFLKGGKVALQQQEWGRPGSCLTASSARGSWSYLQDGGYNCIWPILRGVIIKNVRVDLPLIVLCVLVCHSFSCEFLQKLWKFIERPQKTLRGF